MGTTSSASRKSNGSHEKFGIELPVVLLPDALGGLNASASDLRFDFAHLWWIVGDLPDDVERPIVADHCPTWSAKVDYGAPPADTNALNYLRAIRATD
ncbi:hypothetical protein [Burkholderia ubonensis]|uniref:hypothetical protein n=1 Tax=Burkholderia ubonensis TaxID=101571 RepID=UPI0018E024BA|nr:hypothetical protein [Burkholderia ubonensis]